MLSYLDGAWLFAVIHHSALMQSQQGRGLFLSAGSVILRAGKCQDDDLPTFMILVSISRDVSLCHRS